MKRIKAFVKGLVWVSLFGGFAYGVVFWQDIRAFQGVLAAYHSHLFCSCIYVMKQEETYCVDYARQYLPISEYEWRESEKKITTRALGITRSARFLGFPHGCRLE